MKQYLLSIIQPSEGTLDPERLAPIMEALGVIKRDLEAEGRWVFAGGLHPPSTATVLRAQGDDVLVTDGPFVESKEQLGGFTIITAPDLDVALEYGRRYARATGLPIEVRPFLGEVAS